MLYLPKTFYGEFVSNKYMMVILVSRYIHAGEQWTTNGNEQFTRNSKEWTLNIKRASMYIYMSGPVLPSPIKQKLDQYPVKFSDKISNWFYIFV